jgi:hypothetical protein
MTIHNFKHNLSIIKYNPNAFLEYVKNKDMCNLIENMNNININDDCMLCKKLKEKIGKNKFGINLKCTKK